MSRAEHRNVLAILLILATGAGIAWAGSQGGAVAAGIPVFVLCAALSFAINTLVFAHAYAQQSERYFDLTGSATYLCLVATALVGTGNFHPRALLLAALVGVWAMRLGSFLFARIRRTGRDRRFDELKPSFFRFLVAWELQGLWVLLTLACALAAMTTLDPKALDAYAILGALIWFVGFLIEAIADQQKTKFRRDPENDARFIDSGLWAWSRHPNYFGEITLWVGIALIALPVLTGWQYATLISPLFVYILLTRISGIPLLEARAMEKWGDDAAYRAYRARTPTLFPSPPASV